MLNVRRFGHGGYSYNCLRLIRVDTYRGITYMGIPSSLNSRSYMLYITANNRALITETEATGDYKNISLTGIEMYNFYSNQIVELIQLPDSK